MKRNIQTKLKCYYVNHVTHDWFAIPREIYAQTPQEALEKHLKTSVLEPTSFYKEPYEISTHKLTDNIQCLRFLNSNYSFRYWVTESKIKTRNQKLFSILCTLKDSIPFI